MHPILSQVLNLLPFFFFFGLITPFGSSISITYAHVIVKLMRDTNTLHDLDMAPDKRHSKIQGFFQLFFSSYLFYSQLSVITMGFLSSPSSLKDKE